MSNLFDKWKESVITVYDSQELSTLELLEDITSFNDEIAKGIDDLDLKIDTEINNLNLQKTDNLGDHKGSWQGLNKPTLSEEGMRATVEKLNTEIPKLENEINQVNSHLEQKANKDDVAKISSGTPLFVSTTTEMIDTTKNYVNTSDGYLYVYSNGQWNKSSIKYQEMGLSDGQVTPSKTNSQIPNTLPNYNLYEEYYYTIIENKYIENTSGVEKDLQGTYYITIDVLPNSILYIDCNGWSGLSHYGAFFYDSKFIASLSVNSTSFKLNTGKTSGIIKIPSNVNKLKLNFYKPNIQYFNLVRTNEDIGIQTRISSKWIKEDTVSYLDSPFISDIFPYINKNIIIDSSYITKSGDIVSNNNISMTPLIKTNEFEEFEIKNCFKNFDYNSFSILGVVLNESYEVLTSLIPSSNNPSFSMPVGAYYVNFYFETVCKNEIKIIKSSNVSERKINKNAIYPPISDLSNAWSGKLWTSFGDSITYQNKWQPYVVNNLGLIHTNCGIGSTCISSKDGISQESNAMWREKRIQSVISSNPYVVTIMGGANDWYQEIPIGANEEFEKPLGADDSTTLSDSSTYKNVRTFKGAYSTIIEKLLKWNPNVKIVIIATPWLNEKGYVESPTRLSIKSYSNACREIAEYYGIPCVNIDKKMMLNSLTKSIMLIDNVHPNEEVGGKRIAEIVIGKLNQMKPL